MQTLQKQLIALNRRANAASDAIKLIEKITGKIEVKNGEINALEAGLPSCPEGRTKAGLVKRIETLKSSVQKLTDDLTEATTKAGIILDLSTPYNDAPVAPTLPEHADIPNGASEPLPDSYGDEGLSEQPAAEGTEGGESHQE